MKIYYWFISIIGIFITILLVFSSSLLNNPKVSGSYINFSNGTVFDYPSNWYSINNQNSLPFVLFSNKENFDEGVIVHAIEYSSDELKQNKISDINSAINYKEESVVYSIKDYTTPELISKNIEGNVGIINFKWKLWAGEKTNETVYFFYKIIKCNERFFELSVKAFEPFDLVYESEIEHLIGSFKCK